MERGEIEWPKEQMAYIWVDIVLRKVKIVEVELFPNQHMLKTSLRHSRGQ